MLVSIKEMHGNALQATDGEIGRVDEILFDDEGWTVRFLVVNTGNWLRNRKVLIGTPALGELDWKNRRMNVNLTRDQVENSPGTETNEPVSRQLEAQYYDYLGWPHYWVGVGLGGTTYYPGSLFGTTNDILNNHPEDDEVRNSDHNSDVQPGDIHLRSTNEIYGYQIEAADGVIGHVDDFIVDDKSWVVKHIAIETHKWWPGKKILLPPVWIESVLWPEAIMKVEVTREIVKHVPEWNTGETISTELEERLNSYYSTHRSVKVHEENPSILV